MRVCTALCGHAVVCAQRADPKFPVGKARLETIGVLACATIMSVAAVRMLDVNDHSSDVQCTTLEFDGSMACHRLGSPKQS